VTFHDERCSFFALDADLEPEVPPTILEPEVPTSLFGPDPEAYSALQLQRQLREPQPSHLALPFSSPGAFGRFARNFPTESIFLFFKALTVSYPSLRKWN
jgi:hypothetical protein